MISKRVGIIGSAFNPPHLGHKDIIEQVYRDYDEILLVPSYRHAFGKSMVPYQYRLYMASMLGQAFHQEKYLKFTQSTPIATSSIERELGEKNKAPVFTFNLLEALEERYRSADIEPKLTFIIGPDNASFETWRKFYKGDEILKRWNIRPVSERVSVHSTMIRELIAEYPRPGFLFAARFKNYLDDMIAHYIFENKLYGVH
ncbi:nicotinate-nicotinamide nucleotide adenylyltransferase [Aliikangiella marina]|uniref:nicotinate-nucleotide adenylyltransferase n=1 Tax=Aliikangiella marina TaxID=1712262 RepID=A0A545T4S5_9GAMM|nr:nicotinate-nicotinamide nucleotide adenylyltransferase [Aliikangiella marina]TQV72237.1 nicotinate-nicotinamide nucleotide adenylyltransferase [Aliikangiella marina]